MEGTSLTLEKSAASGGSRLRWAVLAVAAVWVLFALGTILDLLPIAVVSVLLGLLAWRLSAERVKLICLNVLVFSILLGGGDLAVRPFADNLLRFRTYE